MNVLWALISWMFWSLIIIIVVFMTSWFLDIPGTFDKSMAWVWKTNAFFPFVLSLVTFVSSTIMIFCSYLFLTITDPDKFKKTMIHFGQIAFFVIVTYVCITPIYIYIGMNSYENVMYIFVAHVLILTFWSSIILEILNNYRYVLTWIYGSFIWVFFTVFFVLVLFTTLPSWYARLISLLVMLPIINTLIVLFKQFFEMWYYRYHKLTWLDQLGDIFYQIEEEEMEELRNAEEESKM